MHRGKGIRVRRFIAAALCGCAVLDGAELDVDGLGWWRNRELRSTLNRLLEPGDRPVLDANAIEDAAVILTATLAEQGFQQPEIEVRTTSGGGDERSFVFDPTFARPLPRPLAAEKAAFVVQAGVRSYVADVTFSGLTAIDPEKARLYFRTDATLIATERTNAYSPSKMNRGAAALLDELKQLGHAEAQVRARESGGNGGAVTLLIDVTEGPRWQVAGVHYQEDGVVVAEMPDPAGWIGQPWTPTLEQDMREAARHAYYKMGYPDVGVHVAAEATADGGGEKQVEVTVTVVPGPRVVVGQVRFKGNEETRTSTLDRRVRLRPGEPLDLLSLEQARYRISRLGVFESVDLTFEPADGTTRDPVFFVREVPRHEVNLLLGYGSYVQLRGGVELRQMNLFGLAHQSRLELIQSMKSTTADYTYSVPELFGESLDGTLRLFGLQREEIAFVRQEFGANVTLRRRLRGLGGDVSAGYTLQALRNRRNALSTQATDDRQLLVASVTVGISGDKRDNPLRPRHGYHWSAQAESADPMFGGEATYQRYEIAGGYHTQWGGGRWIHVGFTHGLLTTMGSEDDSTLPVNKRFFPGGDSSIRGYQSGEASPRDVDGRFIGAKAYALLNVEIEQALTPSWSLVAFADSLGTAVVLREYPFEERLYSAGLGLRYQTLIGPVRLEYGRNLNRRDGDPGGTWHFSIGFPF
jgi:outer membrane protein insertion porin family